MILVNTSTRACICLLIRILVLVYDLYVCARVDPEEDRGSAQQSMHMKKLLIACEARPPRGEVWAYPPDFFGKLAAKPQHTGTITA